MLLERLFEFRNRGDVEKPFLSHIEDLRFTIIKVASALVLAMVLCFAFRDKLAAAVQHPLIAVDPQRAANIQSLGVADSFTISLELSFYGGLILAFPFLVYFLAEFILPALTPKEKRMLIPASLIGGGLFLTGAAFSYFIVLPQTLEFFFIMHTSPALDGGASHRKKMHCCVSCAWFQTGLNFDLLCAIASE